MGRLLLALEFFLDDPFDFFIANRVLTESGGEEAKDCLEAERSAGKRIREEVKVVSGVAGKHFHPQGTRFRRFYVQRTLRVVQNGKGGRRSFGPGKKILESSVDLVIRLLGGRDETKALVVVEKLEQGLGVIGMIFNGDVRSNLILDEVVVVFLDPFRAENKLCGAHHVLHALKRRSCLSLGVVLRDVKNKRRRDVDGIELVKIMHPRSIETYTTYMEERVQEKIHTTAP